MKLSSLVRTIIALTLSNVLLVLANSTLAAEDTSHCQVLFTNVHVFDGKSTKSIENASVLERRRDTDAELGRQEKGEDGAWRRHVRP